MPDISVKDQMRKLIDVQKIDGEIYGLKVQLSEKPEVLNRLKSEFDEHTKTLLGLQEKLKSLQVQRKEKELELKSKEEEIAKANAQLSQIKTNKEYTAKISEIEHIKADQSVIEEKILLSYEESDAVSAKVGKEQIKVAEEERNYLARKKEAEDSIKIIEDRMKVLENQRVQMLPGISPDFLARYEKILKHKDGLAIVPVRGNACGGCYMNLTSQQMNMMKMHEKPVECEMCSRILYLEDDL